jgi:hypothetical protein
MEKKIKIVVFGMVVALLVTFLPFRQTDIYAGISENAYGYYQEYGNNVCFFPFSETDGMIYYATKAINCRTFPSPARTPVPITNKIPPIPYSSMICSIPSSSFYFA